MHERVEDVTMAALCAIDRVVLPVEVLDYGTSGRVQEAINTSWQRTETRLSAQCSRGLLVQLRLMALATLTARLATANLV